MPEGTWILNILFLVSIIPTFLNLVKNLILNKKFKEEFYFKSIRNEMSEITWAELRRSVKISFRKSSSIKV